MVSTTLSSLSSQNLKQNGCSMVFAEWISELVSRVSGGCGLYWVRGDQKGRKLLVKKALPSFRDRMWMGRAWDSSDSGRWGSNAIIMPCPILWECSSSDRYVCVLCWHVRLAFPFNFLIGPLKHAHERDASFWMRQLRLRELTKFQIMEEWQSWDLDLSLEVVDNN